MKKTIMVVLLALVSVIAMAIPGGYYQNRMKRGITISGTTFYTNDREGNVVATWEIVEDKDGVLTLRSAYGATARATWWREDGEVYINFNYDTYKRR